MPDFDRFATAPAASPGLRRAARAACRWSSSSCCSTAGGERNPGAAAGTRGDDRVDDRRGHRAAHRARALRRARAARRHALVSRGLERRPAPSAAARRRDLEYGAGAPRRAALRTGLSASTSSSACASRRSPSCSAGRPAGGARRRGLRAPPLRRHGLRPSARRDSGSARGAAPRRAARLPSRALSPATGERWSSPATSTAPARRRRSRRPFLAAPARRPRRRRSGRRAADSGARRRHRPAGLRVVIVDRPGARTDRAAHRPPRRAPPPPGPRRPRHPQHAPGRQVHQPDQPQSARTPRLHLRRVEPLRRSQEPRSVRGLGGGHDVGHRARRRRRCWASSRGSAPNRSPAAELDETRNYLLGVFPYGLQTVEGLAARLDEIALYDLPLDTPARYLAEVAAIEPEELLAPRPAAPAARTRR